jgi:hypothetical protein
MKPNLIRVALCAFCMLAFPQGLFSQESNIPGSDQQGENQQQPQTQQPQKPKEEKRAYEPYTVGEFPEWLVDLRRGEIILFGSFPFTFFFVTEGYDLYRFSINNFQVDYAPWPFKDPVRGPYTIEEQVGVVLAAVSLSLVIAVIDYAIRASERDNVRKAELSPVTGSGDAGDKGAESKTDPNKTDTGENTNQ